MLALLGSSSEAPRISAVPVCSRERAYTARRLSPVFRVHRRTKHRSHLYKGSVWPRAPGWFHTKMETQSGSGGTGSRKDRGFPPFHRPSSTSAAACGSSGQCSYDIFASRVRFSIPCTNPSICEISERLS